MLSNGCIVRLWHKLTCYGPTQCMEPGGGQCGVAFTSGPQLRTSVRPVWLLVPQDVNGSGWLFTAVDLSWSKCRAPPPGVAAGLKPLVGCNTLCHSVMAALGLTQAVQYSTLWHSVSSDSRGSASVSVQSTAACWQRTMPKKSSVRPSLSLSWSNSLLVRPTSKIQGNCGPHCGEANATTTVSCSLSTGKHRLPMCQCH